MIKAKPKPLEEIIDNVKDFNKLLIAGCDGCVTVCEAGGLKEVKILAAALRLYFTQAGRAGPGGRNQPHPPVRKGVPGAAAATAWTATTPRSPWPAGSGLQYLAEMYNNKLVFPGVDTCFLGVNEERGLYSERCQACGRCILAETGGICPITRCSKRMLNGPCGGSDKGKCEVNPDIPCGWELIYERLKTLGQLDRFERPVEPKDWTTSRDGGPRKIVREDLRI